MSTNTPPNVDLLPYHLRPEVLEKQRLEHPHLFAPQAEDWNNEWYGCTTRGGHRMTGGNNRRWSGGISER